MMRSRMMYTNNASSENEDNSNEVNGRVTVSLNCSWVVGCLTEMKKVRRSNELSVALVCARRVLAGYFK
jgi:hypothetical protein